MGVVYFKPSLYFNAEKMQVNCLVLQSKYVRNDTNDGWSGNGATNQLIVR